MTNFVALFPGQGSQSIGMMQNLTSNPLIKKTFDEASDILNTNFWDMVNIENTNINQTINTQPLMLAAGIATWRVLEENNINYPSFAAGHSLGEFTALVAAKVFSFENGLHIVKKRAELMQNAVPNDEGAMAAILGLKDSEVINILDSGSVCAIELLESVIIKVEEPAAPVVILLVKTTGSVLKGVMS